MRTSPLPSIVVAGAMFLVACGATSSGGPSPGTDATTDATSSDDGAADATSTAETLADVGADLGPDGLPIGCQMRATTDVNLRSGPSTTDAVLEVIPSGDLVTVVASTPTAGFYEVTHAAVTGWAFGAYFDTTSCTSPTIDAATETATETGAATTGPIEAIAAASSCRAYSWADRGQAPQGYIEGVADVFARAVCDPTRSDVVVVSEANTGDDVHDAISWFDSDFAAVGMTNDVAGLDTLRHAYTLLIGLGMRESSGQYCIGRDTTVTTYTADSAEAGAWQTSWDSHTESPLLPTIFAKYRTSDVGCLLPTFSADVT